MPWPLLVTLLCKRFRLAREEAKQLIGDCAAAALENGDRLLEAAGMVDRLRDAAEVLDEAREAAEKTPKTKAGAIKWLGSCSIALAN